MVGGLLTGCGQNNAPSALAADTASQNTSAVLDLHFFRPGELGQGDHRRIGTDSELLQFSGN